MNAYTQAWLISHGGAPGTLKPAEELRDEIERLLVAKDDDLDFVAGRIAKELDDDYAPGSDSIADAACDAINIAKSYKSDAEDALEALNAALKEHCDSQKDTLSDAVSAIVDDLGAAHESLEQALDREREAANAEGRVTKADADELRRVAGTLREGLIGALNALDVAIGVLGAKTLSAKRKATAVEALQRAQRTATERLRKGSP